MIVYVLMRKDYHLRNQITLSVHRTQGGARAAAEHDAANRQLLTGEWEESTLYDMSFLSTSGAEYIIRPDELEE